MLITRGRRVCARRYACVQLAGTRRLCTQTQEPPKEAKVQQDDPDFITSPLAWALHRAADTLEVGTTVVSGGITIGHAVAKLGFSTAKEVTKAVLPSVIPKDAEILPSLVKGTVEYVKTGAQTIKDGVSTMSSVGSIIGNGVGSALKTGMDVGLPAEPESHISKAFKRLAKTGAASYTEVIDNVANTTVNITREAKDSVLDVVTHVAGNDLGKVTKDTLSIGEDIFNTTIQIKALGAKKLLSKGIKSATKAGVKALASDEPVKVQGLLEKEKEKQRKDE